MKLSTLFDRLEFLIQAHAPAMQRFNELKAAVYKLRHIDPVLGCVITEPPPARPGQGERYHG